MSPLNYTCLFLVFLMFLKRYFFVEAVYFDGFCQQAVGVINEKAFIEIFCNLRGGENLDRIVFLFVLNIFFLVSSKKRKRTHQKRFCVGVAVSFLCRVVHVKENWGFEFSLVLVFIFFFKLLIF